MKMSSVDVRNATANEAGRIDARYGHRTPFVFLLLSVVLALGACTTQVSALKVTTAYSEKSPKALYVYSDSGTTLRGATKTTLVPGTYKPLGENEQGVWYVGTEGNVRIFYTEKKRSDGKRLLASYTGGILVPSIPHSQPSVFIIPSTERLMLVSDSRDAEAESVKLGHMTEGQIHAEAAVNTGANLVGAALGGAIADGLLIYDASGLRVIPQTEGAPGLVTWLDGR